MLRYTFSFKKKKSESTSQWTLQKYTSLVHSHSKITRVLDITWFTTYSNNKWYSTEVLFTQNINKTMSGNTDTSPMTHADIFSTLAA